MMTKMHRSVLLAALVAFSAFSAGAKDKVSVVFEFGAVGAEKVYYSSNTPYTRTTFSPDLYAGFNLPVADVNESCFFGIDLGYDFSWTGYYSSETLAVVNDRVFTHGFSFLPELTFTKGHARFFVGTGLTFGIDLYKYSSETASGGSISQSSDDFRQFKFLWTSEVGAKYYLTKQFSVLADFKLSIPFITSVSSDEFKKVVRHGESSAYLIPRIGLCYMFNYDKLVEFGYKTE